MSRRLRLSESDRVLTIRDKSTGEVVSARVIRTTGSRVPHFAGWEILLLELPDGKTILAQMDPGGDIRHANLESV